MKRLWLLCALGIFVLMLTAACGSSSKESPEESFKKWYTTISTELKEIDKDFNEAAYVVQQADEHKETYKSARKRLFEIRQDIYDHETKVSDAKLPNISDDNLKELKKEYVDVITSRNNCGLIDLWIDYTKEMEKGNVEKAKQIKLEVDKLAFSLKTVYMHAWTKLLGISKKVGVDLIAEFGSDNQQQNSKSNTEVQVDSKTTNKNVGNENTNSKNATDELNQKGVQGNVTATSYGHSSKGFISRLDDGSAVLVDKVNNQTVKISPASAITQIANYQGSSKQSIKLELLILNDGRDSDAANGAWMGNDHLIPVTVEYNYENGQHIPYMIKSGSGASPASYDNYLYEQKNVDAVNMIIEEAAAMK